MFGQFLTDLTAWCRAIGGNIMTMYLIFVRFAPGAKRCNAVYERKHVRYSNKKVGSESSDFIG